MKKNVIYLMAFFSFFSYAQKSDLKLTADIWPPFTNVQGEKSILSDLVQEALGRMDITSTIEIQEFQVALESIESEAFDGSPALWISEERQQKFYFSKPYLHNQLILVGKKGSDVDAKTFNDLQGKKIGVVNNYAYGDFGDHADITIIPDVSNQKNLENLLSDKIDYMLVDALLIQYMLKYQLNDVTNHLAIGQEPLMVKSLHLTLGKHVENAEDILNQFDKVIAEMIADNSYNKILGLNWVKADVDGDGRMEFVLEGDKAGSSAPQNIYALMLDNSYKEQDEPLRYYVDGKLYEDWDNVPKSYKLDLVEDTTPSLEDTYVKFNFF